MWSMNRNGVEAKVDQFCGGCGRSLAALTCWQALIDAAKLSPGKPF